jgi:hypothetical protein
MARCRLSVKNAVITLLWRTPVLARQLEGRAYDTIAEPLLKLGKA